MVDTETRTREQRLRRMAKRQGLEVEKSRARDWRALTYGTYQLVDPFANTIVAGDPRHGYGMTLDEIERELMTGRKVMSSDPRSDWR